MIRTRPDSRIRQKRWSGIPSTRPSVVIEAIYDAVHAYYTDPVNAGVPYDEGEFIVQPIDTADVLRKLGFYAQEGFFQVVVDAEAEGDWFVPTANGHWLGSHRHQEVIWAWSSFCDTVKHKTRFHFANEPRDDFGSPQEIHPSNTLHAVADCLRNHIKILPSGVEVYRARVRRRGETWQPSADEMGPPPNEKATAGRMNPAGIPYLYTAFDRITARQEIGVQPRSTKTAFTATFTLSKPLTVIDLTQTPSLPSVFDIGRKHDREKILFVKEFTKAISWRVTKDGQEHIDYVPSQIICEYLAQIFRLDDGTRLGGLVYPSSVHEGGKNLVVFPEDRYKGTFYGVMFTSAEP